MRSNDSDFRFMATNDLTNALAKESFVLDSDSETKVINAVLKLLDDKNGEVQNLAVKCLVPLVKKLKERPVMVVVDALCGFLSDKRDELRDVAGIGLKTLIVDFPLDSAVASQLAVRILPKLLKELKKGDSLVELDLIDIVGELFRKFGNLLNDSPEAITLQKAALDTIEPLVCHSRPAARKKAIASTTSLSLHLKDELFAGLVEKLISNIVEKRDANDLEKLQSLVSLSASICRSCPNRFAPYLPRLLTIVIQLSSVDSDELREQCLQALETFALRCSSLINSKLNDIVVLALESLKHDPNYDAGDEEGGNEMDEDDEEEESYTDDDDVSWKVRRASAKLIASIIGARPDLLSLFYKKLAMPLIRRFSEREESVRVDVIAAFNSLLLQTVAVKSQTKEADDEAGIIAESFSLLKELVPVLTKALIKHFDGKSALTRSLSFAVLKNLVSAIPGCLSTDISLIITRINSALSSKSHIVSSTIGNSVNIKLDALECLSVILSNHEAETLYAVLDTLTAVVLTAVDDKFYKISREALHVSSQLLEAMRPFDNSSKKLTVPPASEKFIPLISSIADKIYGRIEVTDVGIEIKEKAIAVLGVLIYQTGDLLPKSFFASKVVPTIIDRLQNETTRLIVIRMLTYVCESPLVDDPYNILAPLNEKLDKIVPEISHQLKMAHRQARIVSLQCLEAISRHLDSSAMFPTVLDSLNVMLSTDSNLHILPLALSLLVAIIEKDNSDSVVEIVSTQIVPVLIRVEVESPHVVSGGSSLLVSLKFWSTFASTALGTKLAPKCAEDFIGSASSSKASREAFPVISKTVATFAISQTELLSEMIQKAIEVINSISKDDHMKVLWLHILGEIGARRDLSHDAPELHKNLLALFSSTSEEIKNASAFALGNLAAGNLSLYLPVIVEAIRSGPHQYISLISMKEVISLFSSSREIVGALKPYISEVWHILFSNSEDQKMEEGTRNAIAECLGQLSKVDPALFLPQLQSKLVASKPETRVTVISAIRYTFADQSGKEDYDVLLAPLIIEFLRLVRDEDLNVRRVTLSALNSAVHNKPHLIRHSLPELLPLLYEETNVKEELIHIVEMGPFKLYK